MSLIQGDSYTPKTKSDLFYVIFSPLMRICLTTPRRLCGRGWRRFLRKNMPAITTVSARLSGPDLFTSNKSTTAFLGVVRMLPSGCANSAGIGVNGNDNTWSNWRFFSVIARYRRRANKLRVPFTEAISPAFFDKNSTFCNRKFHKEEQVKKGRRDCLCKRYTQFIWPSSISCYHWEKPLVG